MIRCDIDGVSGVMHPDQVRPGAPDYSFGRRMFMAELMALLKGLSSGGALEAVLYDEHGKGMNIEPDDLPQSVSYICGKPPYRIDWAGGLDRTFDGVILLGYHAKAESKPAILPHTYEDDILSLTLNGIAIGEIGMEAAVAGDFGVPVVLVTGDSAGIQEATAILPRTIGVIVKDALVGGGALCYALTETTELITRAAKQITESPPNAEPYFFGEDVTLEVGLRPGPYRQSYRALYPEGWQDEHTVQLTGSSVTAVWAKYWRRKIKALESVERQPEE